MQPRMRCVGAQRVSPFDATTLKDNPTGSRSTLSMNITANGTMPAANACLAWLIVVKYTPENSSCAQSNGCVR